ncbi:MAG TPA: hypothetical protein VGK40_06490 [Verrucomicrobiae bacterium]
MNRSQAQALATLFLVYNAGAQIPALHRAVPSAAIPGQSTDINLFGENLADVTPWWTSFPAKAESISGEGRAEQDKTVVRLTIPPKTPVGIGALRLWTSNGVSSLLLFMIDDLPSLAGSGTNRSRATAQRLTPPVAVDGSCDELGSDFYKFTAIKGRLVSIEVIAQRLGSPLDPLVRLLDANGRELAYCDDEPGLGADARIQHTFSASGEYYIEIRDTNYQGGPRHRYRLRVENHPPAPLPFPLRAPVGNGTLPSSTELVEAEPNNTPQTATRITVPSAINGRFAKPKDRDWYQFDAKKDQRLIFRGQARSLGSPSELFLRLTWPDGRRIAQANLSGSDEGTITNTFSEAGSYCLLVEELAQRSGPEHVYRVEIETYRPGFALTVDTERVQATQSGSFEIKVNCARRDYSGPIQFALDGGGGQFALESKTSSNKTNEIHTLKATLPPGLPPGSLTQFQIVGRATINDQEFTTTASTMPALRKLFPQTPYPPAQLEGWIGLGIKPSPSPAEKDSVEP